LLRHPKKYSFKTARYSSGSIVTKLRTGWLGDDNQQGREKVFFLTPPPSGRLWSPSS